MNLVRTGVGVAGLASHLSEAFRIHIRKYVTNISVAIVAVAGVASAARGQVQYAIDDGRSNDALGLSEGGTIGWMNNFVTNPVNPLVRSVDVTFGLPGGDIGVAPGDSFQVFVFEDRGTLLDPTDDGGNLVASATATADAIAIGQDIFQSVIVNAPVSSRNFWVAAQFTHDAGEFPAPIDEGVSSNGRSWVTLESPATGMGDAREMDAIGFSGVFLLRPTVTPAPGGLALLGLGGLAATRRRR